MNRTPETGMIRRHGPARQRRGMILSAALAASLLAPAAVWALPATKLAAQEDAAAQSASAPQVIAQGIGRLPRGKVAWTIQRVDVSGASVTPVESFPLGFILSDDASVVVLDESEEVLGILDEGEALFLSGGKPGGFAPWRDPEAGFFALTLIPEAEAASTAATVVGAPFDTPNGRAFEIELGRDLLADGEESTIPGSRSGTPTLFLQTEGTSQLASTVGEPVELAAGQFALLTGDVTVRGAGGPSAFVVAAIGEQAPTKAQDEAASGASTGGGNRANRANRASSGGGGGGGGGNADARAARQAERAANQGDAAPAGETGDAAADRAARQAARAERQAARQAAGTPTPVDGAAGTPSPVTGEPDESAATPTPVVEQETDTEADASPTGEVEQQFTDDEDDGQANIIETTTPVEETPVVETPVVETPIVETPVVETPVVEEPIVETPVVEPPVEQVPATEETPVVEQEIVEQVPAEDPLPQETAPVEEAPIVEAPVEEVPVEQAPVEEAPVEQIPADEAPPAEG